MGRSSCRAAPGVPTLGAPPAGACKNTETVYRGNPYLPSCFAVIISSITCLISALPISVAYIIALPYAPFSSGSAPCSSDHLTLSPAPAMTVCTMHTVISCALVSCAVISCTVVSCAVVSPSDRHLPHAPLAGPSQGSCSHRTSRGVWCFISRARGGVHRKSL